ncbi:radical SAM/SPASM domain-containing protein [Candidatus Omnitrophota bacterium]
MDSNISEKIVQRWNREDRIGKTAIAPAPRLLMLEVTNACNLKCRMCQNPNMTRARGYMDVELGKRTIREAAQIGIKEIALFSTGEPLLYARLDELIIEAKRQKLYCYLSSNGLLLEEKSAEMICRYGLDSFKFSIDASDKEEYEDTRINGDFDKLISNIRLLKHTRDRLQSPLKIICAYAIKDFDKKRIESFKNLFKPICDSILISEWSNLGGKVDASNTGAEVLNGRNRPSCRLLWDRIVVSYDGRITACCVDFDLELCYSDLNFVSLENAWNNETIQAWREKHLIGEGHLMPMCGKCSSPFIMKTDRLRGINL